MTLKTWRTLVGKLIQGLVWSGAAGLALAGLTGTALGGSPVAYDFESALQGWSNLDANGDPVTADPRWVPSTDTSGVCPGPQAGSGYVLWSPFGSSPYPQDYAHDLRVLRSPAFVLGSGDIGCYLTGGTGSASSPTSAGFLGVALRDVGTDTYVLSGRKSATGNSYEQIVFTSTQLASYVGHICTLDLIDSYAGGWGWVGLDSVTIADASQPLPAPTITPNGGNFAAPEEVTIAAQELDVLQDPPSWVTGKKYPSEPEPFETVVALSNDGEHTMALRASTDVGDDWYVFAGVNMSREDGAIFPVYVWNLTYSEGEYAADLFVGVTTSTWTGNLYDYWYGQTGNRVFLILYENSQSTGLTWPVLYSCANGEDQDLDTQVVASYLPIPVSALANHPLQFEFNNEENKHDQVRVLYDDLPLLSDETDDDGYVVYTGDSESGRVTAALDPDDMRFWVTLAGGYMPGQREVTIADTPPIVVRYTSDNSPVTVSSPLVTGPLWIGDNTTIRARAYSDPGYASAEVMANFTSTIAEFRLPTTSATSPLCVEGWRQDGTSDELTVSNGGSYEPVTFVGDRLWFHDTALSATAAVTITVKDNGTTIKTENVTWTATNLTGGGSLSIRQGDSLLLTATGAGNVLTIDADGNSTYEKSGVPGEQFEVAYNTAGTYSVAAKIDDTPVGTLTLKVVTIGTAPPIGVRTALNRTKDLAVTPTSAASQVSVQAPDQGVLQLVSRTTTGTGVELVLDAVGTGVDGFVARLGDATGPILRAYETHGFSVSLVTTSVLPIVKRVDASDNLVAGALQMTPHFGGHEIKLEVAGSGVVFDTTRTSTLWASTDDFEAHNNDALSQYIYYIEGSGSTVCHHYGEVREEE